MADGIVSLKKLLYKIANIDYVVETGTSEDYTYKKWRSGICEAFRDNSGSARLNQTVGKWYYGDALTTGSVASDLFTETVTDVAGVYCGSTSSNGFIGGGTGLASTTNGGTHNIGSGASMGTSYTYYGTWHLYGKWKNIETISN